jgi:hypothetical protein
MSDRATLWRDLAILSAVAVVVRGVAAWLVPFPPHVDAAYYTMVAEQLATGNGFTAPALWSFLEVGGRLPLDAQLPVPSNAHWMPLPAILAGGGMAVLGPDWRGGQVVMVLLSTLLVPMTYLAGRLVWESRRIAVLGAILAIAAGPLLLMYPMVESFAAFGVFGAATLLASIRAVDAPRPGAWLVVAGVAAGLASLTRIDGALLALAPATAWLVRRPFGRDGFASTAHAFGWGIASGAAFLLVVAPWLLRNLDVFGTPLPSPGGRMVWIRDYNEHLSISLDLTVDRYLAWGTPGIVLSKLGSALEVGGRTLGLLGGLFGVTFVAGLWQFRRVRRLAPFSVYFVTMLGAMVLIFTEHAPKGAFLHTAPAWLPVALPLGVAAVAPAATASGRVWRFLQRPATHRFIEVVGVAGAVVLAVAGAMALLGPWQVRADRQATAASFLLDRAAPTDVLLAGDPSSLYLRTGLRGVATPFDPFAVIEGVIDAYGIDWVVVILDAGADRDPLGLWDGAGALDATGAPPKFLSDAPAFEAEGVRIFEVRGSGG